ncbi:SDR family NAD(P)-dependent oxidoreductase [Halobium salinum]|uniref:SDR family NAD(P)-dependent oxidoreductase n=1 Tax=Halobium salinum TaxID=1364940 RepID=A0ABD5P976_9EURY|nr:SDR family NAD(P)-dependent oxidoreductase [Halobium salinum]
MNRGVRLYERSPAVGPWTTATFAEDREPAPGYAGYNATNFGVRGFSEALRTEIGERVRVTLVSPGLVETDLPDEHGPLGDRLDEITPLCSGDVASAVRYAVERPPRVAVNELVIRPAERER